jgi:hypothetical protein
MKIIPLILFLPFSFSLARATETPLKGMWKIESYQMGSGISAWADSEAKPLLKQRISFDEKGVTLGKTSCPGKISKETSAQAQALTSDLKGNFCGKGNVTSEVYGVELSCADKIRFTPYAVKLTNQKILGFGDGITFCLSK